MPAALDRAESDRISHQPRLEARLDSEEATDLFQHGHSLTLELPDRNFEPFGP